MSTSDPVWQRVGLERRGAVTALRLHTDDGPLVWDAAVHRELTEAFEWVRLDEATKVVLLTSAGDEYCTSIDVPSFRGMRWDHLWWEGRRLLNGLNDIDVPVISCVKGPATVHAEIPVMADVVLAAPTTTFADRAHIVRGVAPGDGAHAVWERLLGPSRSRYFLLTAASIDAAEARTLGFVHEILDGFAVEDRGWELAASLAEQTLPVLRYTKAALAMGFRRHFAESLSHGLAVEGCGHWSDGGIND